MIPKGEAFIQKWGVLGIFIARFSGPLRAAVPLVAGIFEMPYWRFQFANFVSAFVWAHAAAARRRRVAGSAIYLEIGAPRKRNDGWPAVLVRMGLAYSAAAGTAIKSSHSMPSQRAN